MSSREFRVPNCLCIFCTIHQSSSKCPSGAMSDIAGETRGQISRRHPEVSQLAVSRTCLAQGRAGGLYSSSVSLPRSGRCSDVICQIDMSVGLK